MNPWMHYSWLDKHPGPFQVGDQVAFRFGTAQVEGIVVEDRGNLGRGGKRLYGVRLCMDDVRDPMYREYEAADLRRISAPHTRTTQPTRDLIEE